jgi:hypothetical protein
VPGPAAGPALLIGRSVTRWPFPPQRHAARRSRTPDRRQRIPTMKESTLAAAEASGIARSATTGKSQDEQLHPKHDREHHDGGVRPRERNQPRDHIEHPEADPPPTGMADVPATSATSRSAPAFSAISSSQRAMRGPSYRLATHVRESSVADESEPRGREQSSSCPSRRRRANCRSTTERAA